MKRRRALSHWSTVGTDRVTRLLQRLLQALTVERTLIAVSDRTQNPQELVRKRAASPIPSIKQSSLLVDVIKDVSCSTRGSHWCLVRFGYSGHARYFRFQTGLFLGFVEMKRGTKRRKLCHTDEETRWRERRHNQLDSREKKKKESQQ